MTIDDIRMMVLDPGRLSLPPRPKVRQIKVIPYTDHLGADALRVWVILDESTTPEERSVENLRAIHRAIDQALLSAGIELFPYSRIVTPTDLEEAGIALP